MKQNWVKAKEWVNVEDVEFLNISEDIYGRDTMTFAYDGEEYDSIVVSGSKPG